MMNENFDSLIDKELADLEEKALKRQLCLVEGFQGEKIIVDGRQVLNFCSNNYLGLAGDSRICQAAVEAIGEEGFGAGASRLVCGHMASHRRLEKRLAEVKGAEDCLTFSSGYMANIGIITGLFGHHDVIFCDRLNHASIIDGIILSRAKMRRYPHRDMQVLEGMLRNTAGFKKRVIITDSVFSMDGDLAPLDRIVDLAERYDCAVMIDEAHALGVLGKHGGGAAQHFGVEDKIDIQMGTLSKAAGSFGAYCCGKKKLILYLVNKARSFIYTTGMPPSTAAASLRAIEIISEDHSLREQLWRNTRYIREGLKALGFNTMDSTTPIIPILFGDSQLTLQFSRRLFEEGILISAIRPPTVPRGSARLRLTVTAKHTKGDMDHLLEVFKRVGKDLSPEILVE